MLFSPVTETPVTDFSRILAITLLLIFTGKISLLVIVWNKKILPKTRILKVSILYFDPVILSDPSIEIEMFEGLSAKQGKNVFFPCSFSSYKKPRTKIFGY